MAPKKLSSALVAEARLVDSHAPSITYLEAFFKIDCYYIFMSGRSLLKRSEQQDF